MNFLDEKSKRSFITAFKFTFGVLFIALTANLTLQLDVHFGIIRSEMSFTENTQLLFVLMTIVCFFRLGRERPELRRAVALIVGFFTVVFIRECDGYLDAIHHGCWIVPALAATAVAVAAAMRDGRSCVRELAEILASPGLLVVSGVVLLLVYSRLFGMGVFWQSVMTDNYLREVKVIAEEGTELLAYGLIWLSALFTLSEFRKRGNAAAETKKDATSDEKEEEQSAA